MVMRLSVYVYQVRLVNLRCLYITLEFELIYRLQLPNSPSQLALYAQDNYMLDEDFFCVY
jgi:hypothetical protein